MNARVLATVLASTLATILIGCTVPPDAFRLIPIPTPEPLFDADTPTTECDELEYYNLRPGQSADDLSSDYIPGSIDIVRVESILEDETLTAVFHLRDIPQEMTFNRDGVESMNMEYMWTVEINLEGKTVRAWDSFDYTLAGYYAANRVQKTPNLTASLQSVIYPETWRLAYDSEGKERHWEYAHMHPRVDVSPEQDTIALVSRIPGITDESTLLFSTFDILEGQDGVSCPPYN